MKRWLYLMVAVAFVAGGILSIAIAQPDKVTIDNKYPQDLKDPYVLPHKAHVDTIGGCIECHHTWKKEERANPQKCSECHKADDKGPTGLKNAYHQQCFKGCHMAKKKQGEKTGPTVCSGCHPSKAKK